MNSTTDTINAGIPLQTVSPANPTSTPAALAPALKSAPPAPVTRTPPVPASPAPLPQRSPAAELRFRRDSFLSSLSHEQLRTFCEWVRELPLPRIRHMVALPPPQGFGLNVHDTTLRRAKMRLASLPEVEGFRETCSIADEYLEAVEEDRPKLAAALSELLLERAVSIARNPNAPYNINELVANVVKLRELELRAERLRLDRELRDSRPAPGQPKVHEVNLNIRPAAPSQPAGTPPAILEDATSPE